jgi:hypothetical protein
MDTLDQVVATTAPLLNRVDEILSGVGAPTDHPVWTQLRRVRLLPGDAVRAVAALRPSELPAASAELRADARAYAEIAESLPPPAGWSGDAADAYDDARRHVAVHLSGGPDSLDERLEATADLADALTDWIAESRADVATALAEIMTSAAALTLSSGSPVDPAPPAETGAAADVAARLLGAVADRYDLAADLLDGSAELAIALPA